jgi:hypothetical protein
MPRIGFFRRDLEVHPISISSSSSFPALQPWVSLGLLYNQSPLLSIPSAYPRLAVRFLNKITFYRMRLLAPCPTPILDE